MFYKPATRLSLVKFISIFGAGSSTQPKEDSKKGQDLSEKSDINANDGVPELSDVSKIRSSCKKIVGLMLEKGVPGLTVCVSRRGKIVWHSAFGYCDVENQIECKPEARMRIASISKPLFVATVVAPMIESNKIDLKSSIHKYLTEEEFPKQKYNGKVHDITIGQLLSHTSGVRHYDEGHAKNRPLRPIGSAGSQEVYQCDDQFNRRGFFDRTTYRSTVDALNPFKTEPLAGEPGKYNYSTYGYTLLSAVVERAHQKGGDERRAKEQIEDFWVKVLRRDWNMTETSLDQDEPIVSNRARYYLRTAINGALINAPYADNSVKWAGGGINSSTRDLCKFGHELVDSYKKRPGAKLKRATVDLLWTEVIESYGLGFAIENMNPNECCAEKRAIYHLGGALGASSALVVYPESEVVVAILSNLGSVNLKPVAFYIANQFAASAKQEHKSKLST